jgi:hypothetical protein
MSKLLFPRAVFDQHRFFENVYKTNNCWFWIGYLKNGYGFIEIDGVGIYSHVLSFMIFKGKIPKGKEICHTCDIRQCINPEHLFAGTKLENIQDAWSKGLGSQPPITSGFSHHLATLTNIKVKEIRTLIQSGVPQRVVALKFGCSNSTAWRIGKGIVRCQA